MSRDHAEFSASTVNELPYAFGGPVCAAHFKHEPEDFRVSERLPFSADGEGPHWLLRVEKRDTNTLDMLDELARTLNVQRKAVGYSGLKDRFAITTQYVTVPAASVSAERALGAAGSDWRVGEATAHRRKLRVGSHRHNAFDITLRDIPQREDCRVALTARLEQLKRYGMPNYFGPQRFGRDGANVRKARQLFDGTRKLPRQQHRFAVSAARSSLFNRVLGARLQDQTWNTLLKGEAVALQGSGSWFAYERLTDSDVARVDAFDLHPSGPLWGAGTPAPTDDALHTELHALEGQAAFMQALEALGLKHERRALRQPLGELTWQFQNDTLSLQFVLAKGSFATSAVRELVRHVELELPDYARGDRERVSQGEIRT